MIYTALLADEWEEMCVVAVSNRVAKAMEKQVFQQLLAGLGLHPPTQQVRTIHACTCMYRNMHMHMHV